MPKKESQVNYTSIISLLKKITEYLYNRIYADCWFNMIFDDEGDFVTFTIDLRYIQYIFTYKMDMPDIIELFSTNTEDIIIRYMYNLLTTELEKKINGDIYRKDIDNTDPT